jgi:aminomethyltransferase
MNNEESPMNNLPNPLYNLHQQAEAEFQPYDQLEIVSTFDEPQAEYSAIRKGCGLMDLPQRGVLELTGKDRHAFLNNLLTNQVWNKETKKGLEAGQVVYAFLLNLQGRIVADMNVIETGERTLLEMDVRLVEPIRQVFDRYLFGEQVKLINRVGQLHEVGLFGPRALEVLGKNLEPMTNMPLRHFGKDIVIWRDDITGSPGLHCIVPIENARQFWMDNVTLWGQSAEIGKRMLRPIGWAAFNATRIEAGRPILGVDYETAPPESAFPGKAPPKAAQSTSTALGTGEAPGGISAPQPKGILPAETNQLTRAVSFTKGCYLGQEIVARMHARQQVARQIVGIKMADDALPLAGTHILDASGNAIGIITSSTISPVLSGIAIALGTLKKPYFAEGTTVHVPAEGRVREAKVVKTPFL